MPNINELVTDRTEADVERVKYLNNLWQYDSDTDALNWAGTLPERFEWLALTNRGAYNTNDLNRVGAACAELYSYLTTAGYTVSGYTPLRTNWTMEDIPTPEEMETYLATVRAFIDLWHGAESALPEGCTQVEYIERPSAMEQYIITDYYPSEKTRVTMGYMLLADDRTTRYKALFGSYDRLARYGVEAQSDAKQVRGQFYNFAYAEPSSDGTAVNARNTVDFYRGIIKINGTEVLDMFDKDEEERNQIVFVSYFPLGLFARTISATAANTTYSGAMRCYFCQIYDDNTLVRNFVPCINPQGRVGLYDTVNGVFWDGYNTTTNFTAGDEVPPVETIPLPGSMDNLTVEGANEIERALEIVYGALVELYNALFYSGEIYAGEV